MKNDNTADEISGSIDGLIDIMRKADLASKVQKFSEFNKPPRHLFSKQVVELVNLVKDLKIVEALPESNARDNLISNIKYYLVNEKSCEHSLVERNQDYDNLQREMQRLQEQTDEEIQKLSEERDSIKDSLTTCKQENASVIETNRILSDSLHEMEVKIALMSRNLDNLPKDVFRKYCCLK